MFCTRLQYKGSLDFLEFPFTNYNFCKGFLSCMRCCHWTKKKRFYFYNWILFVKVVLKIIPLFIHVVCISEKKPQSHKSILRVLNCCWMVPLHRIHESMAASFFTDLDLFCYLFYICIHWMRNLYKNIPIIKNYNGDGLYTGSTGRISVKIFINKRPWH